MSTNSGNTIKKSVQGNIRELHSYIGELQSALATSNDIVRQRVESGMYDEFLLKSNKLLAKGGFKK